MSGILDKILGYGTVAMGLLPGGQFQILTQKVKGGGRKEGASVVTFKNLPAAVRDIYKPLFLKNAQKVWVVYEGERYTYAKAWEIIEAVGQELVHGMGMKAGDCVGIAMRNFPEYVLAFVAIQAAGLICVPLNSLWKTEELQYVAIATC
jgi:long-chain acyl-CoA synthetase